jgi:F0F1-type ATP synthase membrane subunit b/b'
VIDLMPNPTAIVQWFIFMIAVFTLHFGIFKPTLRLIMARRERSIGARRSAGAMMKKSEEQSLIIEQKIQEARKLGYKKIEEAVHAGEKESERLLAAARDKVGQSLETLRKEIELESKEALLQLRQQSQEISRDIAKAVLENSTWKN